MSDIKTKKESNVLTAGELLGGGFELTKVQLESVQKDGGPGVVYLKPPLARDVIEFSKLPPEEHTAAMPKLIGKALVNEDGERLMSDEEAAKIADTSLAVFGELSKALTEMMKGLNKGEEDTAAAVGEASGEAPTSASPTG